MTDTKRMDPSTRFVRSLEGEFFLLREAAGMLGISTQALRKTVHDKSVAAPSFWVMFGKLKIYLYTREDVDELRAWFKAREEVFRVGEGEMPKVGRPRKYDAVQKAQKQREYARSYYWRKQLESAVKSDDQDAILKAKGKLYELEKEQEAQETNDGQADVSPEPIQTETRVNDEDTKITTDRISPFIEPARSR